jgi:hypothetical protein
MNVLLHLKRTGTNGQLPVRLFRIGGYAMLIHGTFAGEIFDGKICSLSGPMAIVTLTQGIGIAKFVFVDAASCRY